MEKEDILLDYLDCVAAYCDRRRLRKRFGKGGPSETFMRIVEEKTNPLIPEPRAYDFRYQTWVKIRRIFSRNNKLDWKTVRQQLLTNENLACNVSFLLKSTEKLAS